MQSPAPGEPQGVPQWFLRNFCLCSDIHVLHPSGDCAQPTLPCIGMSMASAVVTNQPLFFVDAREVASSHAARREPATQRQARQERAHQELPVRDLSPANYLV